MLTLPTQNIVSVHATVSFSQTVVTVPTDGHATVTVTVTQATGFGIEGAVHDSPGLQAEEPNNLAAVGACVLCAA